MKPLDISVVALFFAVGYALQYFVPAVGPITPWFALIFTGLAVLLVIPRITEGVGLGVVDGIIATIVTKSPFAVPNFPAGIVTLIVTTILVRAMAKLRWMIRVPVIMFIHTCTSGWSWVFFIVAMFGFEALPVPVITGVMAPIIFGVAAVNTIVTAIIWAPLKRGYDYIAPPPGEA